MALNFNRRLCLRLCASALLALHVNAAHADEYDTLLAKWQVRLTGGGAINTSDPAIAAQLATITGNAQTAWDALDQSPGRSYLWSDAADWSKSASVTDSYNRIHSMAVAYASTGSSLKGNAALAADIVAALEWMHANKYNAGTTYYNNWWDWHIGSPTALTNCIALMYAQLNATQRANYLAAIDHFVPNPTQRLSPSGAVIATETGANRLDKAAIVALRGVLGKSSAKIIQGRDAVSQALLYVTGGDGFYADGSFIQHSYVAYTGGYGPILLDDMSKMLYLLSGSTWAFTDPNVANAYAWATDAFIPLIYDGAMMDSVRGRGISRQYATDHTTGRYAAASLARLAQTAPAPQAAAINAAVKGWMQRDHTFGGSYFGATPTRVPGVYSGLGIYDLHLLQTLEDDNSVAAAPEPAGARVFAGMDRVMQREPGYALNLSLFSNRTSGFEFGNGENIAGWWTGMGMRALYNADQTQYDNHYWPTIDLRRLPGTTTDRSGSGTPVQWKKYTSGSAWTGGATLGGRYAAVGMDFSTAGATGSTLKGKKSWFLFGDRIVEIGSGIASSDGVNIETIIENRKLNISGSNALTVNGVAKSSAAGWSEAMPAVQWAHLAGGTAGADIGYYWPYAPTVYGLRENRSGSWSAINSGESAATVSNHYLSLSTHQGVNPTNGVYSQVILPGRSAAQTAAYAAAPTVTVLERSATASAASDSALGLVGANFWTDASKTVNAGGAPYLTSNKKAAVLTRDSGSVLQVAVADPTQANTGAISLEINRAAGALDSASSGVTVTQLSPTIKFNVDVNASAGKSFEASFHLLKTARLAPAADAHVRDGSHATANYGGNATLAVKNDGVGYARQAYLKFDLAPLSGTIASARLMLAPASIGQATAMNASVHAVGPDTWTEGGLNWNNKPAAGALLGSWTVPAVNTYAQLDITSQVASAMGGDRLLSLAVSAAANYGANGWVEYASKEYGNEALRPVLVVTYY